MGSTDGSWLYSGWNIDDLEIIGYGGVITPPTYPDISLSQTSYNVDVSLEGTLSETLTISNTGDDNLSYSLVWNQDAMTLAEDEGRSVAGSTLTPSPAEFTPGSSMVLSLEVYNNSDDSEWLKSINLFFPAGVTVTSATEFTGGTLPMPYIGQSGDTTQWYGDDGSSSLWGVIRGGETATATVSLTIGASFSGDMSVDFALNGDIYGADPHSVYDTMVLTNLGSPIVNWLTLSPLSGTILPAGNNPITLDFDAAGLDLGIYTGTILVSSNDPDESSLMIPVTMNVIPEASIDPVTDLSILVTGTLAQLNWTAVPSAINYLIYRSANAYGSYSQIGSTASNFYFDLGVASGDTKYFYMVVAQN